MSQETNSPASQAELENDIGTLTRTQLKQKYGSTYSSWTNMKSRCAKGEYQFAPEFEDFPSFLRHVGPRPSAEHTLDRIDFNNPLYGPGLVRWLDKKGQANNRSSTIFLTVEGETKPLAIWAEETGQRPDTLRERKAKGWSDAEVVYGKANSNWPPSDPWNWQPWPDDPHKRQAAEAEYQRSKRPNELRIDFYIRRMEPAAQSLHDFVCLNQYDTEPELAARVKEASARLSAFNDRLEWARGRRAELVKILRVTPKPRGWG
ncbi:MAG: hypothetical protein LCH39_04045 [Proteobacteria bacterium]|nr:hypothetical protein [Pseudomonadota bacterium]